MYGTTQPVFSVFINGRGLSKEVRPLMTQYQIAQTASDAELISKLEKNYDEQ